MLALLPFVLLGTLFGALLDDRAGDAAEALSHTHIAVGNGAVAVRLRTGTAEVAPAQAHEIHAALQGQNTHCIELGAEAGHGADPFICAAVLLLVFF